MSNITVYCIGDLHFQDSNIKQAKSLTEKIIENVKKLKPTLIVLLGDILHTHEKIYVTPFKLATEFIRELSFLAPTYVIIGNHDMKNSAQFLSDDHPFNSLKDWDNVYVVDNVINHEYEDLSFVFIPYLSPGNFLRALNESGVMWETSDAIFAHQEFKGANHGPKESVIGDVWEEGFPLVISGHIHVHQVLGKNIFYTGSSIQTSFSENDEKFNWLFKFEITNEESHYIAEKVRLGMKLNKTINVNYDDIENLDLVKYKNFNIKLDITGYPEQFKQFRRSKVYKKMTEQGIKISFNALAKDPPQFKTQLDYKGKNYVDILRQLTNEESKDVQELCENLLKECDIVDDKINREKDEEYNEEEYEYIEE